MFGIGKSKYIYYCREIKEGEKCKYKTKDYDEYREHLAEIHHTDDCEMDWY